ncbi:hypothetical protein [Parasitella parasitica]|uniref:K Homology domain-containing protein n=1 Tax=Parasitella parasitica TaxID=35722 RepID=A0A0B7N2L3_9FUNG|nr:hypothetical protein [Parasitella parasitica]
MNIHSFCLKAHHQSQIKQLDVSQLNQQYSNDANQIEFVSLYENDALNVTIKGYDSACLAVRGEILRNNPVETILAINSPNVEAIYHPEIKGLLTEIARELNVEIKVHAASEAKIRIAGSIDSVELARVKILVLLDQLAGLNIEFLHDIPCFLHFLLSGRKHVQLHSVMDETATNIYLQSPFSHLTRQHQDDGLIYLTGESTSSLARAKELLKKLTAQKMKSMHCKDSNMEPKKLDWILLNKRNELRKIMRDNGSYFKFPVLGSGSNSISVYAENRIYVERSIRLLNHLTSSIYEASFELINGIENHDMAAVLSQLSQTFGVDVTYQPQTRKIELFGTEEQVCSAYRLLGDMSCVKGNHQSTMFALELATEQREFVSGKKNGKINKIMKTYAVTIRFSVSNEYNSRIIVESTDHNKALEGLAMLQDELPAETSFYVPEIYHRRIIGVAGKNIQKVMKKYGVYVKFSGAEEFASLGGYFENEDNVVARTPMKNQMNLEHLKLSVTEFIGFQKDRDFVSMTVAIPYHLQRIIPSKYSCQLREICRTNNAKIWWPERLGSDNVVVYGPQTQIALVASYLSQFVSKEVHLAIALTQEMEVVLSDAAFIASIQTKLCAALQNVELAQAVVLDQPNYKNKILEWNSGYSTDCSKIMIFRFLCHNLNHCAQDVDRAKDIIKALIEAEELPFDELAATDQEPNYISQDVQNHLLPSSILASTPALSEEPVFDMDIPPSPPLSESYAAACHPYDNTALLMPSMASSSLSAPFPTARNIWASPRIQNNNSLAPIVQGGERLLHMNQYPFSLQPPLSPPTYQQAFSMLQESSLLKQQRNSSMRPSTSAPTIGMKQQQQQPHHKSWPDVFFGGRDLFDALPSRRASASTQYAFELYPNGPTTSLASSPSMHYHQQQQQLGYKSAALMNKYQHQFNIIAQSSPFVYSNSPLPPLANGASYNNPSRQEYTRFHN